MLILVGARKKDELPGRLRHGPQSVEAPEVAKRLITLPVRAGLQDVGKLQRPAAQPVTRGKQGPRVFSAGGHGPCTNNINNNEM